MGSLRTVDERWRRAFQEVASDVAELRHSYQPGVWRKWLGYIPYLWVVTSRLADARARYARAEAERDAAVTALVEITSTVIAKIDRTTTGNLAHNLAGLKGYLNGMGRFDNPAHLERYRQFCETRYDEVRALKKERDALRTEVERLRELVERAANTLRQDHAGAQLLGEIRRALGVSRG